MIAFIVTMNSLLGAFQEGRAERAVEALRRLSASTSRVLRDGREQALPAHDLVTGDVLVLATGDEVSADARLIEAASMEVASAALTGESAPTRKETPAAPVDTVLAERRNMVYAGTQVTAGRGRAVVVGTGLGTEVGKIAALTTSAKEPATPLAKRIAELGRYALYGGLVMSAVVIGIGLLRHVPSAEIILIATSQLVAMVPEGLPVAVTVALALGANRMARRGALVRRLGAVETLGATTVICSDKTGTLTKHEMTVTAVHLAGLTFEVPGTGYAPEPPLALSLDARRRDRPPGARRGGRTLQRLAPRTSDAIGAAVARDRGPHRGRPPHVRGKGRGRRRRRSRARATDGRDPLRRREQDDDDDPRDGVRGDRGLEGRARARHRALLARAAGRSSGADERRHAR